MIKEDSCGMACRGSNAAARASGAAMFEAIAAAAARPRRIPRAGSHQEHLFRKGCGQLCRKAWGQQEGTAHRSEMSHRLVLKRPRARSVPCDAE